MTTAMFTVTDVSLLENIRTNHPALVGLHLDKGRSAEFGRVCQAMRDTATLY